MAKHSQVILERGTQYKVNLYPIPTISGQQDKWKVSFISAALIFVTGLAFFVRTNLLKVSKT